MDFVHFLLDLCNPFCRCYWTLCWGYLDSWVIERRADLRLNQPRYATLPNIMKAKKKPISQVTPEQLGVKLCTDLVILEVVEPPKRKPGVIVASVDELLDKLKNEAHVI